MHLSYMNTTMPALACQPTGKAQTLPTLDQIEHLAELVPFSVDKQDPRGYTRDVRASPDRVSERPAP